MIIGSVGVTKYMKKGYAQKPLDLALVRFRSDLDLRLYSIGSWKF